MKGPHKANLKNDRYWLRLVKKGIFAVSKKGLVTRVKTGYTDWAVNSNYQKVTYKDRSILLHRLVALVYLGKIPRGYVVNHKNGRKLDCRKSNLEIVTLSENNQHAVDTDLNKVSTKAKKASKNRLSGERNMNACFTDKQVRVLRKKFEASKVTISDIANKYDTTKRSVRDMLLAVTYSNVAYRIKSVPNVSKGRPKVHSDLKVKRMRKLKHKGWTNAALAEKFNMHVSTVSKLLNGHKW
jgi:predicted transcriptional regulator